ncbi:MAG: ABC transporter substrate-binding protein, partial [Gammaproteobacteria bacterium]|nr:ABC transporter substrate-binding protein [Gammaproteobacteria bacterium]
MTEQAILIGIESEAYSFSVNEENLGMRLVVRHVNDNGGIHGRKIIIAAYDRDRDDPVANAVANAKRLVEEDDVFLLFNFGGPAAVQIGEYAMANDVPYLFPHTALLTVDGDRHIFTSFPRYAGESRTMLRYLVEQRGAKRIGIVYAPNIYGEYFLGRVQGLADELGYEFAGGQALQNNADSADDQVAALRDTHPDTIIMALYPAGAREVVAAKAELEWDVRLVSSGPLTDEQYLNMEGDPADGTLGLCHYPDPNESDAPGIAEYRRLMSEYYPDHPMNRYSLYGYVFGKLVVEGLQRAGRDLTEARFLDGMESISDWDSGGILPPVSFSPDNHHAQKAGFICELENGRFKALSG